MMFCLVKVVSNLENAVFTDVLHTKVSQLCYFCLELFITVYCIIENFGLSL